MNEEEMLAIVTNSDPSEDSIVSKFNVVTFFLRLCQKSKRPVAVFLANGIKLTGRVLAFDEESILFTGQGDESVDAAQLIILCNVASIRPVGAEPREALPLNRPPRR